MDIRRLSQDILSETEKIIVGKADRIRLIIMAVLADGHVLLDDLPGVGKTTLVKTISIALAASQGVSSLYPTCCPATSSECAYTTRRPEILSCARGRS